MSLSSFGLGFVFGATDNASPVMNKVERNFSKLDKTTDRLARRMQAAQGAIMIGVAGVAAGAAGMAAALKSAFSAGEFEQQAVRVGKVAGATAEELDQLRNIAIEMGLKTQFSPTETIKGLGELTVRGLTAQEAMKALEPALDLAAGGMISIESASSATVAGLKVFSLEASEAGIVADKLLKISTRTALQARDLELALGTVGRGASIAKQSIDEMLPSIGLVANTGVDASVAASSVSSALVFMSKKADAFKKLGFSITDASGKFRPFLDIVLDTQSALSGVTDGAEAAAKATELFGRFGLSAFSAISAQLSQGIKTPTGEILKGAEAVDFLRKSMKEAAGTAKEFREAILDTLPGQLVLLKGVVETLQVVFGGPLAKALKPVITGIKDRVTLLITAFQSLPPALQKAVSVGFLMASMFVFLSGTALVLMGTFVVLLPIIQAALGVFISMLPAMLLIGVATGTLIAGFVALKRAFDLNIGGFGDTIRKVVEKAKLFFGGLFQLITKGFISGPTAEKLKQAENVPILRFLQVLVRIGFRVQKFFKGLASGFNRALIGSSETFSRLGDALLRLGRALGLVNETADASLGPSSKFAAAGIFIAEVMTSFLVVLIGMLSTAVEVVSGFTEGTVKAFESMAPALKFFMESIDGITDAFTALSTALGLNQIKTNETKGVWDFFAESLGLFIPTIVGTIALALGLIVSSIEIFVRHAARFIELFKTILEDSFLVTRGLFQILTGDFKIGWESIKEGGLSAFGKIGDFFKGMIEDIEMQFDKFLDFFASAISGLPAAMRTDSMDAFIAERQLRQLMQEDDGSVERVGIDRRASEGIARTDRILQTSSLKFKNNTGESKEGSGDGIGKLIESVQDLVDILTQTTSNRKPQTIKLILDEILGGGQETTLQTEAALSGGGDFFRED